jgi:hypothetical protein
MANRYWRGGTGSWTNANTANWAASANACTFTASRATTVLTVTAVSSGAIAVGMTVWHTTNTAIGTITAFGTGTGGVGTYTMSAPGGTVTSRTMSSATIGASAPTSADPVVFDADSNVGTAAFTVTTSTSAACGGMSVSGLDGTMTWAGTTAMTISGSLLLPTSNFTRTYTGALTFNTTGTITSNGVSFANTLNFNGSGQTFTLGSDLTTTGNTTFTTGSISLQTFTLSALTFSSSNTNTRSINFGTGKISVSGTTGTVWNMADWTNFTVSGTPLLQKPNAGGTISHGPSTGPFDYTKTISVNVSVSTAYIGQFRDFQAGGTITLTAILDVFGNLTINASSTFSSSSSFTLRGGPTGTSSQSITTNNVSLAQLYQFSNNSITVLNGSLTVGSLSAALDTQGNTVNATTMVLTSGSFLRTSTLTAQTVAVSPGIDPGTSKIILQGGVNNCSISSSGTIGVSPTTLLYDVELNPTVAATTTTINGDLSFNKIYSRTTVQHFLTMYLDTEVGGQQYFVTNFDASGTTSGQIYLGGYGNGTSITQTSGTVNLSYATINSIIATGGATWNAFTSNGNIDGGNNTGWNFTAPVGSNTSNFFMMF